MTAPLGQPVRLLVVRLFVNARLALAAALCVCPPVWADAEEERAAARELEQVVEALNELDDWLGSANDQRTAWLVSVRDADRAVNRIRRSIAQLKGELTTTENELAELQTRQADLEARKRAQAAHIAQHLLAAYRLSGRDFLKTLLNQEAPESLNRMMRYHGMFTAARVKTLDDFQETLAELETTQARLAESQSSLAAQRAALATEETTLVAERDQRQALLVSLEADIGDRETQRQRLRADQERLEALLARLREARQPPRRNPVRGGPRAHAVAARRSGPRPVRAIAGRRPADLARHPARLRRGHAPSPPWPRARWCSRTGCAGSAC